MWRWELGTATAHRWTELHSQAIFCLSHRASQVTLVLPSSGVELLWQMLGEGDIIFARYIQSPTTDAPVDFDRALYKKISDERAPADTCVLANDKEAALVTAEAALEELHNHTSLSAGSCATRACHQCGKPWWLEMVYVECDRNRAHLPCKEMVVSGPRKGAVQMPLPVIAAENGGIELHVECGPSRLPLSVDPEDPLHPGEPPVGHQGAEGAPPRPQAKKCSTEPKPKDLCPFCCKSYARKADGSHSAYYRSHVLEGKGCESMARSYMATNRRPRRKARESEEDASARNAFKLAKERGFCTCHVCQSMFSPHLERFEREESSS